MATAEETITGEVAPLVDELRLLGGKVEYQSLRDDEWRELCTADILRTTPVPELVVQSDIRADSDIKSDLNNMKESIEYAHHRDDIYKLRDEYGRLYIPFGEMGGMDNHVVDKIDPDREYGDLYASNVFNPIQQTEVMERVETLEIEYPPHLVSLALLTIPSLALSQIATVDTVLFGLVVSILLVVFHMLIFAEQYESYNTIKKV